MPGLVEEFESFRAEMNERILSRANIVTKRFFALDGQTYAGGALDERTKEFMGLAASAVLRCDDCIRYHVRRCHELGMTEAEFWEAMSVPLVVGGSIVIPHLRRAVAFWDELAAAGEKPAGSAD
jgi:AhpD family alkylhydroperoxidase